MITNRKSHVTNNIKESRNNQKLANQNFSCQNLPILWIRPQNSFLSNLLPATRTSRTARLAANGMPYSIVGYYDVTAGWSQPQATHPRPKAGSCKLEKNFPNSLSGPATNGGKLPARRDVNRSCRPVFRTLQWGRWHSYSISVAKAHIHTPGILTPVG